MKKINAFRIFRNRNKLRLRRQSNPPGFTLGEMVIVIAIIAILAGLIAPLAVNVIEQKRVDACREELANIKKAIVGDPSLIEGGVRSSFGFVGAIGVLPTELGELRQRYQTLVITRPPNTLFSNGWYYGWNGPYISDVTDPWGNDYNYSTTGTPATSARIWSNGPNSINDNGTGDDIVIDIRQDEAFSLVSGNTFDKDFVQATFNGTALGAGLVITVDYPDGTNLVKYTSSANLNYTSSYIYQITRLIPIGIRSIRFSASGSNSRTLLLHVNNGPMTTMNLIDK